VRNARSNRVQVLVIVGLVVVGIRLIWVLAPNLPPLGRLPGEIVIERPNSRIYFPIVTPGLSRQRHQRLPEARYEFHPVGSP
jgi:hypothetical protein